MNVTGLTGRVTCAGRLVASLRSWSIQYDRGRGRLSAVPAQVDEFLLETVEAVTVELDVGKGGWRWDGMAIVGREGTLEIELRGRPRKWEN